MFGPLNFGLLVRQLVPSHNSDAVWEKIDFPVVVHVEQLGRFAGARFIDMVFEILHGLQHDDGKTIIMVEQNAKKGLEFADIGYVLVSGEVAIADTGDNLLANPKVGQLFLGG